MLNETLLAALTHSASMPPALRAAYRHLARPLVPARHTPPLSWQREDYADAPDALIVSVTLIGAEQVSTVEIDSDSWVVVRTVGPELDSTSARELTEDVQRWADGGRAMWRAA